MAFRKFLMIYILCLVPNLSNFGNPVGTAYLPFYGWLIKFYITLKHIAVTFQITLIQTSGYFKSTEFFVILFIFGIAYISPLPIMAGIATFQYLKHQVSKQLHFKVIQFQKIIEQNFIGLVQAQERWGPPDPQERYLRHVYNPREETHSRKKNPVCRHECFLRSNVNFSTFSKHQVRCKTFIFRF